MNRHATIFLLCAALAFAPLAAVYFSSTTRPGITLALPAGALLVIGILLVFVAGIAYGRIDYPGVRHGRG